MLQNALQRSFCFFDFSTGLAVQRLAGLAAQRGVHAVKRGLAGVQRLQRGLALLVLPGKGSGAAHGAGDLLLAQIRGSGDRDALLLAGVHVAGLDLDDAVGVDVERHLNFRHTRPGTLDASQGKGAQQLIVLGELAFALQNLDLHGVLKRRGGGEYLAEPRRDR